ncbi:hypothetical protein C942_01315 [Photobacterium marinum]|uniref:Uncharacterized protein n=1 Tax=Photobacterium marinum TaxID=1056511 RepID=L8JIV7_9GAMM|nr:hypothetical protein C942_01315 [Photobacterium marinum]
MIVFVRYGNIRFRIVTGSPFLICGKNIPADNSKYKKTGAIAPVSL